MAFNNYEKTYKASAILFYRCVYNERLNKNFMQVFLHYEHKFNAWSHFGGKKEYYDKNSFNTAIREMNEEKGNLDTPIVSDFNITKYYFNKSKMIVYYVYVNFKSHQGSNTNWFCVDTLPSNVRSHLNEQFRIPELMW